MSASTMATIRAVASNIFLFGLILGMAGTIEVKSFRSRLTEYRGILMGMASQFLLLPFLGFCVVKAFQLDEVAGITLLITTTSPGGGFSGLLCSLFNADLALSVAMTTVSTVVSLFFIPLNALIYIKGTFGVSVSLPWGSLFLTVGVVIAAVVLGLVLSSKKPEWHMALNRIGTVCGVCNIILAAGSSSQSDRPFWEHPPLFMFAIGLPCLFGLVLSLIISKYVLRIAKEQSVAICIECCYQNTALAVRVPRGRAPEHTTPRPHARAHARARARARAAARHSRRPASPCARRATLPQITVALSVFKSQAGYAAGIPLIYGGIEPLVIVPFCLLAWKLGWTYAPSQENFCAFIAQNYQPESGVPDDDGPAHQELATDVPPPSGSERQSEPNEPSSARTGGTGGLRLGGRSAGGAKEGGVLASILGNNRKRGGGDRTAQSRAPPPMR